MADTKISALTDGGAIRPTDDIPAVRSGANVRVKAGPSDFQPAIVTGNYYKSNAVGVIADQPAPNGDLRAYPIWFSHTETWTRILVNITTGTGGAEKIRLGIWANDASNKPGALLLDSGELDLGSSGEISATISELLQANTLYWIGCNSNDSGGASTLTTAGSDVGIGWIAGNDILWGGLSQAIGYMKSVAFAALPDPFGTPDDVADAAPMIWLRKV